MADEDFQNDPRSQLAWDKVRRVHLTKQHLSPPVAVQRKRSPLLEKKVSKRIHTRESQSNKSLGDCPKSKQTFLSKRTSDTLLDCEHISKSSEDNRDAHNVKSVCDFISELKEPIIDVSTEVSCGDHGITQKTDPFPHVPVVKNTCGIPEQSRSDGGNDTFKCIDTYAEWGQTLAGSRCSDATFVDLCDDPHDRAKSSDTGSTSTNISTGGLVSGIGSSSSLVSMKLQSKQQTSLLYFFKGQHGIKFVKDHSGLQTKTSEKLRKGVGVYGKVARSALQYKKEKSPIKVTTVDSEVPLCSGGLTSSCNMPITSEKPHDHTLSTTSSDALVSSTVAKMTSLVSSYTEVFSKRNSTPRKHAQMGNFSNQATTSMSSGTMTSMGTKAKVCPFYKKVAGTSFVVDAFSYENIPGCSDYFLSHFHSDHYMGLKRSFSHPIHCTRFTGALVVNQLKVAARLVLMYDLGTAHIISGVRVTFLEANHCPGAALILFQLPNGVNILHTGDFRVCPAILGEPLLTGLTLHTVHLDTTYCDQQYELPTQDEVIRFVVSEIHKVVTAKPKTLVVCGSYTIGKERVFIALAKALGCRAGVSRDKKRILSCLDDREIDSLTTTNLDTTRLHVIPMHKLSIKELRCYLGAHPSCTAVVGVRPTGWTYGGRRTSTAGWHAPQISGGVSIYNVPYSEHSSVKELESFVRQFHPKKVIPTVGVGNPSKRQYMSGLINSWLAKNDTNCN